MSRSSDIVLAQHDSPRSLNPEFYTAGVDHALLFPYLLKVGRNGELLPDLALKVPTRSNGGVSADGRTVTYFLRRDATWEDGAPITAADVVFTYRALATPSSNIVVPSAYAEIRSVTAVRPDAVKVVLRQPDWSFVALFLAPSTPIVPSHAFPRGPAQVGDEAAAFGSRPLGGGPFTLARWRRDEDLLLEPNRRYFGAKPGPSSLKLRFMGYDAISVGLLDRSLDAALDVPVSVYQQVRGHADDYRTYTALGCGYAALIFNVRTAAMIDVDVRKAVLLAIDQQFVARVVTGGVAKPYSGLEGAFSPFHDQRIRPLRFDPSKSRELLDRAGWQLNGRGIRQKAGRQLELLYILGDDAESQQTAVLIQSFERKVGIEVVLKQYGPAQLVAPGDGPLATGRFDLFFANMYGYSPLLPRWWFFCSSSYNENPGHYCSRPSEADYRTAMSSLSPAAVKRSFSDLERRFVDDVAVVPLWQRFRIDICRKDLAGCDSGQIPATSDPSRLRRTPQLQRSGGHT
jgi:peptide/nickel transport system substrate-binding protein